MRTPNSGTATGGDVDDVPRKFEPEVRLSNRSLLIDGGQEAYTVCHPFHRPDADGLDKVLSRQSRTGLAMPPGNVYGPTAGFSSARPIAQAAQSNRSANESSIWCDPIGLAPSQFLPPAQCPNGLCRVVVVVAPGPETQPP